MLADSPVRQSGLLPARVHTEIPPKQERKPWVAMFPLLEPATRLYYPEIRLDTEMISLIPLGGVHMPLVDTCSSHSRTAPVSETRNHEVAVRSWTLTVVPASGYKFLHLVLGSAMALRHRLLPQTFPLTTSVGGVTKMKSLLCAGLARVLACTALSTGAAASGSSARPRR